MHWCLSFSGSPEKLQRRLLESKEPSVFPSYWSNKWGQNYYFCLKRIQPLLGTIQSFCDHILIIMHGSLQCTAKINGLHILYPLWADASPKPKLVGGDRRILKENFEDDSIPEYYCMVFFSLLYPFSLINSKLHTYCHSTLLIY